MPAGSKPGEYRGGRKKGTPNKSQQVVSEMLAERCGKDWIHPAVFNAAVMCGLDPDSMKEGATPTLDPAVQADTERRHKAAQDLMPYVSAKLKHIEHSGELEGGLVVVVRKPE